jgi:hypothetical protein
MSLRAKAEPTNPRVHCSQHHTETHFRHKQSMYDPPELYSREYELTLRSFRHDLPPQKGQRLTKFQAQIWKGLWSLGAHLERGRWRVQIRRYHPNISEKRYQAHQEMVHHSHTLLCTTLRQADLPIPQQRRANQFQLHQSHALP